MDGYILRVRKLAFSLCGIRPHELGEITLEELDLMFEAAMEERERRKYDDDFHLARLMSFLANASFYKFKDKHPNIFKPEEFMPEMPEEHREQTAEEQIEMCGLAHRVFKKRGK